MIDIGSRGGNTHCRAVVIHMGRWISISVGQIHSRNTHGQGHVICMGRGSSRRQGQLEYSETWAGKVVTQRQGERQYL